MQVPASLSRRLNRLRFFRELRHHARFGTAHVSEPSLSAIAFRLARDPIISQSWTTLLRFTLPCLSKSFGYPGPFTPSKIRQDGAVSTTISTANASITRRYFGKDS